ncbi:hypothetical protein P168DRAFT_285046 [Aspergillus campestris IBT 28561]|uniref:Uncharacterized protein n=1 Tax=Aspergillus campestris (strain IBT 28561) TaxID=1392248 RepID=A0A2I1CTG0_ASPC2|nr:uncharacterized protein P168DRAFT_285046 [Aspergillus campestris IBT 28561]PKY00899.1 hypothetical protein P168DRAFT_285046 [Aspergillus campestris IBT 28561]
MSSSSKWEATSFEILTQGRDRVSDQLFANGRMQVPLRINIKAAAQSASGELVPYKLSPDELDRIRLKDHHTNGPLPSAWQETDHKSGDWSDTFPNASAPEESAPREDDSQSYILWISTTENGLKHIQATIPNGQGTWQTTKNSIALTAVYPIRYRVSESHNIEYRKNEVAKGSWTGEKHPDVHRGDWTQYNWYFSTTAHPTKQVELHDFSPDDLQLKLGDKKLRNAWRMKMEANSLQIAYVWECSQRREAPFGCYYMDRPQTMTVNQAANALRVTLLSFTHPVRNKYPYNFTFKPWFEIFDIYGNSGRFSLKLTDENAVEFENYS